MQDTKNCSESQDPRWTLLIGRKVAVFKTLSSTLLLLAVCLASGKEVRS